MTVISAMVEANGWVLAVRGDWGSTVAGGGWARPDGSTFEWNQDRPDAEWWSGGVNQFPLAPEGAAKIVVNLQSEGFDRSGGQAVLNSARARSVVATRPLRVAYSANFVQPALDETDHGDGTRTIRFALSDRVYSTCTISSVSFLEGWKAGEGGGLAATVTNGSTISAPLPIFRWANEPWPLVQGTVGTPVTQGRVEMIIATHHPEHVGGDLHQAVAAVKMTAFDGTTSVDTWFTAPATSPLYGDDLRCWGGLVNLSGLSAGPITVHATVYPWVGAARETGNAHSTSITAALQTAWGAPFHLFYDPDGTLVPRKYVAVDPASANATATDAAQRAAVTLHDTPAAALAAPLSAKPANAMMALARLSELAPTLTGRNGFANVTRFVGWSEILLPEGTHTLPYGLAASQTLSYTGSSAGMGYLVIAPTPDASAPRTNVILSNGGTSRQFAAVDRVKFRGIRVELGTVGLFINRANNWVSYEACDVRSVAAGGTQDAYQDGEIFTSQMQSDIRDRSVQPRGWFSRNTVRTAALSTAAVATAINVTIEVPGVGETRIPDRTLGAFSAGTSTAADAMLWGCKVYAWNGPLVAVGTGAFMASTPLRRLAVINTLVEAGELNARILEVGETLNSQMQDAIFEGVTFAGGRFNFHNEANRAGTTGGPAFRVANSPNTTIIVGVPAHGLTSGDTITTSGSSNANLNRTNTAVTVLDANRFSYVAAAAVTTVPGTLPTITVTSGARSGDVLPILRENLQQTGNAFRYCAMERNATKHDIFNSAANLTGSWELLYGVGFRGNINANRGTASPSDFQYAYYGIGSEAALDFGGGGQTGIESWGVNWFGWVDDATAHGPESASPTYSGDYRAQTADLDAYTPSRLLGKGNGPAVIDRDGAGNVRGTGFAIGALGSNYQPALAVQLQPNPGSSLQQAGGLELSWFAELRPDVGEGLTVTGDARLTGHSGLAADDLLRRVYRVTADSRRLDLEPD